MKVKLTRVPEYFNFWDLKPLEKRDFSVPVHKRSPWQRKKGYYGGKSLGRRRQGKGEGEGGGVLETLVEGDGSTGGSEGGDRRKKGGLGDGEDGDGKSGDQSDLDRKDKSLVRAASLPPSLLLYWVYLHEYRVWGLMVMTMTMPRDMMMIKGKCET